MKAPSLSKVHLKNPLVSLLQISKTTSHIHQVHARLITSNLIADPFACTQLLTTVTLLETSMMNYAEFIFTQIHQPNTFMYNTMIKGYAQSPNPERALQIYGNMKRKGILSDNYTYPSVLKACGMMARLVDGEEVHGEVVKRGFGCDLFVVNGLIGMYCKCGELGWARMVFDGFVGKDLVSWNLMLGGYVRCRDMGEAQKMFEEMPDKDVVSWCIMIDGYGKKISDVTRARILFDSMPVRDLVSWNSIIDGHAKGGELVAARQLFERMPVKNVISWSIMIDCYARHGNSLEALNLFRLMLCQGTKPDKVSVVGVILACAQLGALDQGRWIHMYMKKNQIIMDLVIQTALVDMYMKCGSLDEARRMFNSMSKRSIVSWNAMIVGLGMNGFGKEALEYFALVKMESIPMDDLIFLGALTACTHAGLVTEGLCIFNEMKCAYGISPKLEHYSCLVDLLGRAGYLDKALDVLQSMPMKPSSALWGSLLLACRTHQDVPLAENVVDRLVELRADDCGVHVLLSNIYADVGMWEDALTVRRLMKKKKMKKETGRSIIEVDGNIEEFVSGEKSHILSKGLEWLLWSSSKMPLYEK